MKDCLVCIYNAFGDTIYVSAIIDELLKKYDNIYMETNSQGQTIFGNDPRITNISFFAPWDHYDGMSYGPEMEKHLAQAQKDNPDKDVIDFFGFADYMYFDTEIEPIGFVKRLKRYGRNWHDRYFEKAGLKMPANFTASYPSISLSPTVLEEVEKQWYIPNKEYFRIIIALGGSTRNKGFPAWMPEFGKRLIDSLPKAEVFTLGDAACVSLEWKYARTTNLSSKDGRDYLPLSNAIVMTKFANYVLGPETMLLAAAGMYGTPKSILCTQSSVEQLCKYHKNDQSMQATIDCSPCYRTCYEGPYRKTDPCAHSEHKEYEMLPKCTDATSWNLDSLFNRIHGAYLRWELEQEKQQ